MHIIGYVSQDNFATRKLLKRIGQQSMGELWDLNNSIMSTELLYREMLAEMRSCIHKEDVKAGLPPAVTEAFDIESVFIFWQQFNLKVENLKKYIESLDYDIAARVPWGDLTFDSEEGFVEGLPITRCWTARKECFETNHERWAEEYGVKKVSEGQYLTFFTSSTPKDQVIVMEGAEEATVCPSPASTLIMLQTRAKDSLKLEQLKMSDYAVEHYRSVEAALGLTDTIHAAKRKKLMFKLRKLFQR